MKNIAISNIGWNKENDDQVYTLMKSKGFNGLEIAPTRIFPEKPYEKNEAASSWAKELKANYGFTVPSMQSIWYGKTEKLFGSNKERNELLIYTKRAIDFAETVGCKNLVFGCPRNRSIPDGADRNIAISFFKEMGDYASEHGTVVGMEANPPIYNTNYINTTIDALELIRKVDSEGFKLNLDVGTMIENAEEVSVLKGSECLINHVHISEPGLSVIQERELHSELAEFLTSVGYNGFISIEVGTQDNIDQLSDMMDYVRGVFCDL